jgi:hypothetical protein
MCLNPRGQYSTGGQAVKEPKPGQVVKVEWLDATAYADDVPEAWVAETLKTGGVPVVSVGFLGEIREEAIIIVQSKFENGNVRQALCIPRAMIKRIARLREG